MTKVKNCVSREADRGLILYKIRQLPDELLVEELVKSAKESALAKSSRNFSHTKLKFCKEQLFNRLKTR